MYIECKEATNQYGDIMNNGLKLVNETPTLEIAPITPVIETEETNVDFPVFDKRVIYDAHGNIISGFSAITNTEDKNVNAIMSDRYTIVNHEEAHDIMDRAAKNLCPQAKGNVSFQKNNGFMSVVYDLPQAFDVQVAEGDALKTRLVGMNSVDGSRCLTFQIDFLRQVCTNGMKGFATEFSFTRKHSKFIHEDVQEFNIAAQVQVAWKTVADNAAKLKNNTVNYEEGMEAIKALVDRKLFPKKLQTWINEEWRRASAGANDIQAENGSNLWTLYHSFTSAITHHKDSQGRGLSEQSQELYGNRINKLILKLAA